MTIVAKIGGAAIEDAATLRKCARSIAELAQDGHRVAVVHGGGSALTRMLNRLGKKSEFVDGLGSNSKIGHGASWCWPGLSTRSWWRRFNQRGCRRLDLRRRWYDVPCAEKVCPWSRLGICGRDCFAEPCWIEVDGSRRIPVLASLALGADGEYYNVNADEMAASCAAACHANALIFLTDVPGVRDAAGSVMPWLSTKQAAELAAGSIISGGILPKLQACGQALKQGVGRVNPAGKRGGDLPQFYLTKLSCGTEVTYS